MIGREIFDLIADCLQQLDNHIAVYRAGALDNGTAPGLPVFEALATA